MEALKLIARSSAGKLSIAVPEEFDGKDLAITVEVQSEIINTLELTEEIIRKRRAIFGKARNPNYPTNKYDVYNQ